MFDSDSTSISLLTIRRELNELVMISYVALRKPPFKGSEKYCVNYNQWTSDNDHVSIVICTIIYIFTKSPQTVFFYLYYKCILSLSINI